MSISHNLTEGLTNSFDFSGEINGKVHTYTAIYPSAKQLRPLQTGYARLQEIDKEYAKLSEEDTTEKKRLEKEVKKVSDEITKCFEALFTPQGDSMPIADFLEELPSPARKNFDKMIQAEMF